MAEFSRLVITSKGQALLAKMIEGSGSIEFTRISSSSAAYTDDQLEGLESLSNVEQTSLLSKITRTNEVAVEVEAAFTNTELTSGYYIKTLGLYASDPDDGEILYAVTREKSGGCYMPAYNGVTVSGAYVQLVTMVGNAENVSLEVDQAAVATIGDIQELRKQAEDQTKAIEEAKTAADEAKKAVDGIAKNPWLVDGDTEARPLTVVTDNFSTYPVSDGTHAYAADARGVGNMLEEDRRRISELEEAGKGNSKEGWLIAITLPQYIRGTSYSVAPLSLQSNGNVGKTSITVSFIMPTNTGIYSFTFGAEFILYNDMGTEIDRLMGALHVCANQTFGVSGMKPSVRVSVGVRAEDSMQHISVSIPDENIHIEHL